MEKVIENIKVWDDLIDSLKKREVRKYANIYFKKVKKVVKIVPYI